MKGKSVMFVGDSLGKNQWESLVCLIHADAPQTSTQMARGDPLSTLKFLVMSLNLISPAFPFPSDPYLKICSLFCTFSLEKSEGSWEKKENGIVQSRPMNHFKIKCLAWDPKGRVGGHHFSEQLLPAAIHKTEP